MSFHTNESQQISLFDSFANLTAREQKALENSWAKLFSDELFPAINEEPFRVLYSAREMSRSNTPVNILVGAEIIKQLFDLSDDEVVENLMLDLHFQYALHTTSYDEQPLSDKSLTRFRSRCYDYKQRTGINLWKECMVSLAGIIEKLMGINPRIKRMDSMMIEANIKRMSRMELLYSCVARMVKCVLKTDSKVLPENLVHYTEKDDQNKVIYHARGENVQERIETILQDGNQLLELCKDSFADTAEYQLLVRCFSEQTKLVNSKRVLKDKEDGGMDSSMLQNPSDPDATFRRKAGKEHRGYVANLEESVGKNGSVITDYQVEKNNYSDGQFFRDSCNRKEASEETTIVVADGAYSGDENVQLAKEKNIDLVTTGLLGKDVPEIYAKFELNEEGTEVLKCPAGYEPKSCCYTESTGQCEISMPIGHCKDCPYRDQCHPRMKKRVAKLHISRAAVGHAKSQSFMKTEEFRLLAKIRNGVETLPSLLRNKFRVDRMPRGLIRTEYFFGSKVSAVNFLKLLRYRRGSGHYASNPLIT